MAGAWAFAYFDHKIGGKKTKCAYSEIIANILHVFVLRGLQFEMDFFNMNLQNYFEWLFIAHKKHQIKSEWFLPFISLGLALLQ